MPALTMVTGKSSICKFTAKIDFPIGYFMLPLLTLIIGSPKSFPTLFEVHKIFEPFDKKWLTILTKC